MAQRSKAAASARAAVRVTARHVRIPQDLVAYAREKADRLARFDRRVERVHVVLGLEGDAASVEIVVQERGRTTLVSRAEASDGWAAVDLAFGKAQEQVKRTKERRRDIRQRRVRS